MLSTAPERTSSWARALDGTGIAVSSPKSAPDTAARLVDRRTDVDWKYPVCFPFRVLPRPPLVFTQADG